jgi:hypothetical protein
MIRIRTAILIGVPIGFFLAVIRVPIGTPPPLSNYGVKNRPVGQKVISNAMSSMELLKERTYLTVASYLPFVRAASKTHGIPANVLLAILYEEEIHRKPFDIKTYGPAQLGLGELEKQGLPQRLDLLIDPEVSIFILAAKLKRLQKETGSLEVAITLHNGYSDYLLQVRKRAKDPRILQILKANIVRQTFEA